MSRLASYLVRLFSFDALALFGVAIILLFLAQLLRSFEIISAKGQDILTLMVQTALSMPTLAIAFSFVCLGIGLARGLRSLQQTQELHIIHTSRRLRALFGGIGLYTLGAVLAVLALTNLIEPVAKRLHSDRAAAIAADLVSRTLTPHRFIEITPGVTLVIGSRGTNGELGSFFAHDTRNAEMARTYRAATALVAEDGEGYVLRLNDGAIQYLSREGDFSEVSFTQHDLAVERLTGVTDAGPGLDAVTTPELLARASAGGLTRPIAQQIGGRFGEGFRVLAICLMAAALAAFPHGRRARRQMPIEITILGIAFLERLVSSVIGMPDPLLPPSGPIVLVLLALGLLGFKLRRIGPQRRRSMAT